MSPEGKVGVHFNEFPEVKARKGKWRLLPPEVEEALKKEDK